MKKALVILLTCMATAIAHAQSPSTHALGVRFGGGDGAQAEISYQQFIGGPNRLEFDLGFFDDGWNDGFKFTLMYHWVHGLADGFYWYVGAGGSIGGRNYHHGPHDDGYDDGVFLDANGQLGIEYDFNIPLQISLDMRPEIGLINDDFDMGFGLGIRYTF